MDWMISHPWICGFAYLVGIFPAYKILMWLEQSDGKLCTVGMHRSSLVIAVLWPVLMIVPICLTIIVAVAVCALYPFIWLGEKVKDLLSPLPPFRQIGEYFGSKEPCK